MSNTTKDVEEKDSNDKDNNEKDSNYSVNPPGNPMLKQDGADLDKARQNDFAAAQDAKASQTANQTANVNQHNLPIKQPNKATNNS